MEPHIVIVIPCYNEATRLQPAAFLTGAKAMPTVRFLFVNDGSNGFLVGSSFSETVTQSGSLLLGFNSHESETNNKGEPLTVLITVTSR